LSTEATSESRLAGRVALITGAASGLGAGCARAFASAGAQLALLDHDGAALRAVAEDIARNGGDVVAHECDVRATEELEQSVAATLTHFGRIDVALANAGIAGEGTALDVPRSVWDDVLAVNLTGAWLTARSVLPAMILANRGSIIFQASVTALQGRPAIAAYTASKGGLVALSRQIACDVAHHGIRVNTICPGTVATPMALDTFRARGLAVDGGATSLDVIAAQHPLGRLGDVDDVAAAAIFLASDESSWITGITLTVDGGITAVGRELVPRSSQTSG
jgi:NAD(P)-dependent dehydrogenase (short-subunit alcohol dehydrogenase family)